ncbi:hypothetical protein AAFC00_004174 [Neodothiora populina]|uniref:SMP domain-containing protein n=1 Tax=Neodothiora populina TaxID=2781224 RepID=A0ABR3PIT0_9PEZI
MASAAVTQKPAKTQQVSRSANEQPVMQREEKEASASGSASAGLNLNIFGAISGAFSGKSSKQQENDGSSIEREEKTSHISGVGMGQANAAAAANAEARARQEREQIMASK